MAAQLARVFSSRWVWLGFVGSLLVAWASCHPEFSFAAWGWPSPLINRLGSIAVLPWDRVLLIGGAALLTWAWWRIRPNETNRPVPVAGTLALWCLPLLAVPPVLSGDPVLYADLGWTVHTGANPYLVGLASSGGPFAPYVDPLWAGSGVAYPPLTLRLEELVVVATGAHPYGSIVAMRIPALLSVAAMLFLIPRIARLLGLPVRGALWLGLLNPLLVLHFIGGAHNDSPMVAMTLAAVWVALKYPTWWAHFLLGPVLVGLAMSFKQQGGLAVIAVAGLPVVAQLAKANLPGRLWLLGWRTAAVTAVTLLTFLGVSLACGLGNGWLDWLDLMGVANTPAPLALLSKGGALLWQLNGGSYTDFLMMAGRVGTAILFAVLVWIGIRFAARPLHLIAWASLAVAVLGQAMHPWYLPWSLALLGLIPLTRRQRYWVFGLAVAFCLWNAFQTALWHGQNPTLF